MKFNINQIIIFCIFPSQIVAAINDQLLAFDEYNAKAYDLSQIVCNLPTKTIHLYVDGGVSTNFINTFINNITLGTVFYRYTL